MKCKRHAPFDTSDVTRVDPNGKVVIKRTQGRVNNYNRWVLLCLRANHDIKILSNGEETRNSTWYVTAYATKALLPSYNASALLADNLAYIRSDLASVEPQNKGRRLIGKCVNTISRLQELSTPQIISYIMEYGDKFASHMFTPVYIPEIKIALQKCFEEL